MGLLVGAGIAAVAATVGAVGAVIAVVVTLPGPEEGCVQRVRGLIEDDTDPERPEL